MANNMANNMASDRTANITKASRRGFLRDIFSAGAVILAVPLTSCTSTETKTASMEGPNGSWTPGVFVGLNPDGTFTLVAHRSEMGTGARTALPMLLADELEADWKRVKVVQATGDAKYGSQNTDGSCSVRDFYDTIRDAGATARLMLERAAAAKWSVPAEECKAQLHTVVHTKTGKKADYGELVALAKTQPVPKKAELKWKPASEYRYVGKDFPTLDRDDLCAGRGTFGIDAKVPGMVYASIERSPVYGGHFTKFDDSEAKKVKGVLRTATIEKFKAPHMFQALGGVAVIADNTWAAVQGRKKLKVDWDLGPHATYDSDNYKAELKATASKPCKVMRNIGDVDKAFAATGAKVIEAEYYCPHLSHAPMEPPAAVAEWKDSKVTAWANTQNPQAVQDAVAAAMGIKKEDVTCHVTLLGGGFGRKSKPDYVCEAALLSKQVGKPVKVVWTREEDIKFDFYHSVAAMYMKAAVDEKGKPTAWLQRSVFPSIGTTFDEKAKGPMELEVGMGWNDIPYQIVNHRAENGHADNHVRIGWLRAVANIYHAFGVHSFADELAAAAKADRVQYLLDLIGPGQKLDVKPEGMKYWNNGKPIEQFPYDTARLRRVIELVAEKSGWGKKKNLGIAAHRSFLSYVAAVVEVDVDSQGRVRIPAVHIAADAGTTIYPERVRAQFEGAAVFGTSIAMMGEITAKEGRIVQSNFHNYPVARMNEAPLMTHVYMVNSTEAPAGVGEPGVPPIAPAICNAIFAATGKRVRDLPVRKTKLG